VFLSEDNGGRGLVGMVQGWGGGRTEIGCGGLGGILQGVGVDSWMSGIKTQSALIAEVDVKEAGEMRGTMTGNGRRGG